MANIALQLSDVQQLSAILNNDTPALKKIYSKHLPHIISLIKRNKGTSEDAKDVFQEAILVIYEKAKTPDFELKQSFGGYLYGVCRFLWLRQLKKKHRNDITLEGDEGLPVEEGIEEMQIREEKRQLFREVFARLGEDCRNVLQSFFDGMSMKEIAEKFGYTASYVKLKKFKCKEQFSNNIKKERRYSELIS